jgi:16S rRNA (cytidine1402-2'-O)-methyltransferase
VVCRELTKRYEEVTRGRAAELATAFAGREVKGEVVVLVDRAAAAAPDDGTVAAALDAALETMSVKDAATFVSQTLGIPRKIAYRIALDRSQG